MFDSKGLFLIPADQTDEDTLMEVALEAGADDVNTEGENFEVLCDPSVYQNVIQALADADITPEAKEIARIPQNTVDLDAATARKVLKLMERLDDHDDVQKASANFNIPEDVMAEIGEE